MFDNRLDVLSPATAAQQDDAYDLATTGRAAAARPGRACCRRYYIMPNLLYILFPS